MTYALADYLAALERALRSLPAEERASIIAEIRSHIEDSTAATGKTISEALDSLGDPLELASAYLDQRKLEDAVVRSAHGTLLVAILEQAGRSFVAALLGFCALFFYLCVIAFAAIAVLKPIIPQQVGFWYDGTTFTLAILDHAPANMNEQLGYAIIPVAILLGVGSFLAGRALTRAGGRMLLRKTRQLPG
jgi:Predicted membrane protein